MIRKRTLGKTGLEVSELALGTWGLAGEAYGSILDAQADATIAKARELGITLIDTADLYGAFTEGHERMESRLGRLLEHDKEAVICTKGGNDLASTPPRKRFDRLFLQTSAARSAERLKRAPDLYLLHNPTAETLRKGEAVAALDELVSGGVVKRWGVSCGDAEVARTAIGLGAAVVELAYSLLEQEGLHAIVGEVATTSVGVLARSPLMHGLLCGTWNVTKAFADGDHRRDRWMPTDLRTRLWHVSALRGVVGGDIHTLRSLALRFALANEVVGSVVVGSRTAMQIEQNVRAIGEGPPYLGDSVLARLPEILQNSGAQ